MVFWGIQVSSQLESLLFNDNNFMTAALNATSHFSAQICTRLWLSFSACQLPYCVSLHISLEVNSKSCHRTNMFGWAELLKQRDELDVSQSDKPCQLYWIIIISSI